MLVVLAICVASVIVVSAGESSRSLDWNVPVAVSMEIELYQLESLSNDELRRLHQPHVDIAKSISAEYGVNIRIGTIDCYFMSRDGVIYTIANTSLAATDYRLRELAAFARDVEYSSRVFEAALESECDYAVGALIFALNYEVFDPVYAHYRIQEDGVDFFFAEIESQLYTLSRESLSHADISYFGAAPRTAGVYRFRRAPTFSHNALFNHVNAWFCIQTPGQILSVTSTPYLTVVSPWFFISRGHNLSVQIHPGFPAGSPNSIISQENGVHIRRNLGGGQFDEVWWTAPLLTGFQVGDRTHRVGW